MSYFCKKFLKLIRKDSQRGVSMIELMLAVMLLAISLTAIVSLSTKSIQLSQVSVLRKDAIVLARSKIEDIKAVRDVEDDWDEFYDWVDEPRSNEPNRPKLVDDGSDVPYSWSIDMTNLNISGSDGVYSVGSGGDGSMIRVTVNVDWTDAQGDHTVSQEVVLTKWR